MNFPIFSSLPNAQIEQAGFYALGFSLKLIQKTTVEQICPTII